MSRWQMPAAWICPSAKDRAATRKSAHASSVTASSPSARLSPRHTRYRACTPGLSLSRLRRRTSFSTTIELVLQLNHIGMRLAPQLLHDVQFPILKTLVLEHFFYGDHGSGFHNRRPKHDAEAPVPDDLLRVELPLLPVNHFADIWGGRSRRGAVRAVASSPIPLRLLPRELVYC